MSRTRHEKGSIAGGMLKVLLGAIYAVLLVLIGPVSVWLVFAARTDVGKGLAAMGLLTLLIAADLFVWFRRTPHAGLWGWSTVVLVLAWIGVGYVIVDAAPSGQAPAGSPVSHRFVSGAAFPQHALANVVPEVEQVNLALLAVPALDPIMTYEQSRRVAGLAFDLYDQMEQDANFHALGSAMFVAYDDLLGRPARAGHYYLYIPRKATGPKPAILLLHGRGGNLKVYTWVFSKLAEPLRCAVIAPSCGTGDWSRPAAAAAAMAALDDASKVANVDANYVFLAGVSEGAIGARRLGRDFAGRFRGLALISPAGAPEAGGDEALAERWRDRSVLIATGEADRRAPVEAVRKRAAAMKAGGVRVKLIVYPGQDHFLLFSKGREVLTDMAAWLDKTE